MNESKSRHRAAELTLYRLRSQDPGAVFGEIVRLTKPEGIDALMRMAISFADDAAAALEKEHGSREAAIPHLEEQIADMTEENS